jgi:hypothetical protein
LIKGLHTGSNPVLTTKKLNKMKKIVTTFILLTAVMLQSCEKDNTQPTQPIELSGYKTYTLDGCEYIVVGVGQNRWGSHKGNCKNPIHYAK